LQIYEFRGCDNWTIVRRCENPRGFLDYRKSTNPILKTDNYIKKIQLSKGATIGSTKLRRTMTSQGCDASVTQQSKDAKLENRRGGDLDENKIK